MSAILPISVPAPVPVTTNVAVPRVTDVFWNSMFVRSPNAASGSCSARASFATGALSPVKALSATSRAAEVTMRPSAGMRSPASTMTMSPGTRSSAEISIVVPDRSTRALGTCSEARAATLACAFNSWREPRTTLSSTRNPTNSAVSSWPIRTDTRATTVSITFMGSAHCRSAIRQAVGTGARGRTLRP